MDQNLAASYGCCISVRSASLPQRVRLEYVPSRRPSGNQGNCPHPEICEPVPCEGESSEFAMQAVCPAFASGHYPP